MSQSISNYKKLSKDEKQTLAKKLTSSSAEDRDKSIKRQCYKQAAQLYRTVVRVFGGVDEMKRAMEAQPSGLTARCVFVDITMCDETQTGPKSRRMCKAPSEAAACVIKRPCMRVH